MHGPVQSALHIHGFCPCVFNQPKMENLGRGGRGGTRDCEYTKHVQAFLNYHCSLNNMV